MRVIIREGGGIGRSGSCVDYSARYTPVFLEVERHDEGDTTSSHTASCDITRHDMRQHRVLFVSGCVQTRNWRATLPWLSMCLCVRVSVCVRSQSTQFSSLRLTFAFGRSVRRESMCKSVRTSETQAITMRIGYLGSIMSYIPACSHSVFA